MQEFSLAGTGHAFYKKSIEQAQVPEEAGTCRHGVATFPLSPMEAGTCRHGVATFPQKAPNYQRILSRTGPLRPPVQAEGAWVG